MYSQKLKSGKVRFFESYVDPMTMIRKTTSVTMEKDTKLTRKEAQELLSARVRELEGRSYEQTHVTLKEISEAYRASRAPYLREQTLDSNMYSIRGALRVLGEKTVANNLTAGYVLRAFDQDPHEAVWKNEKLKRFKTMMRWAKTRGMVGDISWLDDVPKYDDNPRLRREEKYLEKEELEKLVHAMSVPYHRELTVFLVLTGLRIGEALALTPSDVDLQTRLIHVTKTYIPSKKKDGPTKADGSTRDIFIQDEILPIMADLRPKKYLFEAHGERIRYDAYRKYLHETSEKAIGRAIVPHALRHTHTSLLAAAGVPLDVISRRLGHADSKITREIYFHVTKGLTDLDHRLINAAPMLVGIA
jgi:integrase